MKGSFQYVLYGLFFVIFAGIIALGIVARENSNALVTTSVQIDRTNAILAQTGLIDALDDENEMQVRNYLLTNDTDVLRHSEESEEEMLAHLKEFKGLVKGNVLQQMKADSLEDNILQKTALFDSMISLQHAGKSSAAALMLNDKKNQNVITWTGRLISVIENAERQNLSSQNDLGNQTTTGLNGIFWFLLFLPVVLLASSLYAIQHAFNVKKKSEEEILKLNASLEKRVGERTREVQLLNESLEKRVEERTAELEEVNKELESFSYSVSHDLRAPLRVIEAYAKMLVKKEESNPHSDSKEILGQIIGNTQRMERLIGDLLKFSKMGRTTLAKRNVDMNTDVRVVVEELRKSLNGSFRSHVVVHDLKPAACDPSLMHQVWGNLISNAVKYSGKKEMPVVEIGSEDTNGKVVYYVKDNGAGFDMSNSGKLFGVFQRLHKSSEYEGTGVGLALVQKIISKHGGKIWAEAAVGQGAIFYFTLS